MLFRSNRTESGSSFARETSNFYFERNPSVAAVLVTDSRRAGGLERKLLSTPFFLSNELDPSLVDVFLAQSRDAILENGTRYHPRNKRFSRIRYSDARTVLAIRRKRFAAGLGGFLFRRKTLRQLRCGYATDDVFGKRRGRYPDSSGF